MNCSEVTRHKAVVFEMWNGNETRKRSFADLLFNDALPFSSRLFFCLLLCGEMNEMEPWRISMFVFNCSIPESTPSTMTALHQFGAEMLKLSRGLDAVSSLVMSNSSSTTSPSVMAQEAAVRRPLLSKNAQALVEERFRWVFFFRNISLSFSSLNEQEVVFGFKEIWRDFAWGHWCGSCGSFSWSIYWRFEGFDFWKTSQTRIFQFFKFDNIENYHKRLRKILFLHHRHSACQ